MAKYVFYRNDNKIIALTTYAGKTVKGYAKCSPEDTFDNEKGKELAAARCGVKVAVKRAKNAEKQYFKAVAELLKAQKRVDEMSSYLIDSNNKLKEANEYVAIVLASFQDTEN